MAHNTIRMILEIGSSQFSTYRHMYGILAFFALQL
jgi:hypothetical protein